MTSEPGSPALASNPLPYRILDLNYFSLYIQDFKAAITFNSQVFGPWEYTEGDGELYGWRMGATWLTVFPRGDTQPEANPRNAEFAVQVAQPDQVDALHQALLAAGARNHTPPLNTRMYVAMRFACADDPFGVRIDVYCLIKE